MNHLDGKFLIVAGLVALALIQGSEPTTMDQLTGVLMGLLAGGSR